MTPLKASLLAVGTSLALLVAPDTGQTQQPLTGARLGELITSALDAAGQSGRPVVSARRGFPGCDHDPVVSPLNGSWQTVQVHCDSPSAWDRSIRVEGAKAAPRRTGKQQEKNQQKALVLVESLPKGTVLANYHMKWVPWTTAEQDGLINNMDAAIGRRLKTNLGAGRALLARHLDHDWQVTEGAYVTISIETAGISVQTGGEAVEAGQLGERIRVRNTRSGKIVHATVTGRNKVTIRANI